MGELIKYREVPYVVEIRNENNELCILARFVYYS